MRALVDSLVYFPDRALYGDPADVGLAFTDLSIPTEDGETLPGWWVPARATPSRGHVLFFHGHAGTVSHRLEHAQALTAAGLDLFTRGLSRVRAEPVGGLIRRTSVTKATTAMRLPQRTQKRGSTW